jgi:carboxyl-terminal processing protease
MSAKRRASKLPAAIALCAALILGASLSLNQVRAEKESTVSETLPWEDARLLAEVLEHVRRDYVDRVDDRTLIENAIRGMVSALDPHSSFLDNEEYDEIRISTTGNYSGVGIEVVMQDGAVKVVAPIEGTPAARAGIEPGDTIISIDGAPVEQTSLNEAINRMRGRAGTTVKVKVTREGVATPLEFLLERSNVQVHSVKHELLEPGYGYVRITHFSETTSLDLGNSVAALKAASPMGLKGVVLDLRNNPGGVLEAAVSVSDAFLDDGVIVSANGRVVESKFEMDATPGDILDGAQMVVLVNSGSASASEIVAGALKDHGRALLVGRTTFGKGSVQTVMPLSDGRAIKLTTSRYYTPAGISIHQKGIAPDVVVDRDIEPRDFVPGMGGETLLKGDQQIVLALDKLKDGSVIRQSRGKSKTDVKKR